MAFPGTFNFSYYKGDTYEFRIYPKDASGASFDLTDYGNATFKIATVRGTAGVSGQITAYASISSDKTHLTCTIKPADASSMTAGTSYVYDVQIRKPGTPYDYVYTLLTGNISVTDDVVQGNGEI